MAVSRPVLLAYGTKPDAFVDVTVGQCGDVDVYSVDLEIP
jgi:hypothetical protein